MPIRPFRSDIFTEPFGSVNFEGAVPLAKRLGRVAGEVWGRVPAAPPTR
jgi:hypothetical protein